MENENRKLLMCRFCNFRGFYGEQALEIHEEICRENQSLRRRIKKIKSDMIILNLENSILCGQNESLRGDLGWIVNGGPPADYF